jgi:hypothetical protein
LERTLSVTRLPDVLKGVESKRLLTNRHLEEGTVENHGNLSQDERFPGRGSKRAPLEFEYVELCRCQLSDSCEHGNQPAGPIRGQLSDCQLLIIN